MTDLARRSWEGNCPNANRILTAKATAAVHRQLRSTPSLARSNPSNRSVAAAPPPLPLSLPNASLSPPHRFFFASPPPGFLSPASRMSPELGRQTWRGAGPCSGYGRSSVSTAARGGRAGRKRRGRNRYRRPPWRGCGRFESDGLCECSGTRLLIKMKIWSSK